MLMRLSMCFFSVKAVGKVMGGEGRGGHGMRCGAALYEL